MKETVSAGGVVVRDGLVAVVAQRGGVWSLPKGRRKKRETLLQAALREIEEETGLTDLTPVRELGTYRRPRIALDGGDDPTEMKTITFFLFTTRQTRLAPRDPKHPEARWVPEAEVAALLTHPKDAEFFEGYIRRRE